MAAVREERRPARSALALGRVRSDERLANASRGVDHPQRVVAAAVEEDHAARAPRAVGSVLRVADRLRRPSGHGHAAQLSAGHERDRAAVGRPDRAHAPSVPGIGRDSSASSGRSQMDFVPVGVGRRRRRACARRARATGGPTARRPRGFGTWKRTTGGGLRRAPRPGHGEAERGEAGERGDRPGQALAHAPPRRDDPGQPGPRAALGDPLRARPRRRARSASGRRGPSPGTCAPRGRAPAATCAWTLEIGGGCDETIAAIRLVRVLPSKARASRGHLVEHGAQREDVGARVGRLPLELLGRHVLERADDRALLGERPRLGVERRLDRDDGRSVAGSRGQAEVEELGAAARQHDVAGLQVAVDDARRGARRRAPARSARRGAGRPRSGSGPLASRCASDSPSMSSSTR